jgi:hypothetical protein
MRVSLIEAIPENDAERPRFYPQWVSTQLTPSQNYNNLGGTLSVDPGFVYRRTHLMFLSGATPNDVRTDGLSANAVSEVGIKGYTGLAPIWFKTWDFSQNSQGQFQVADDNAAVPGAALAPGAAVASVAYNPGVGMIDWAQGGDPRVVDPVWGVDLAKPGVPTNALRVGLSVDSNTNLNVVALHEAYGRY